MTKVNRKILLSIVTFLAVLCFGLALNVGNAPVAKAEGTLSIKRVEQTLLEAYNSNPGSYRSEYWVTFDGDDDMLSAHKVGDDITATYSTFGSNIVLNASQLSAIQGGYKVFKADKNAIKIKTGRPVGYAKFEFKQGLAIGEYVLAEDATYYENQDWTFTTTAPEFRIQTVWGRPFSNATQYQVTISHTAVASIGVNTLKGIKINGTMITESEDSVVLSEFGKTAVGQWNNSGTIQANYGNEGDAGAKSTAFHFYMTKAAIQAGQANGGATITFPKGFAIGSNVLAKEQTFVLYPNQDHGLWSNIPIWVESTETVNEDGYVKSIKQTAADGYSHFSTYEIELNGETDAFANFANGDDLTYYLESTNFYRNILANGTNLISCDANKDVTFTKLGVNKIEMKVKACVRYLDVEELVGIKLPGQPYSVAKQDVFYENEDWTFTQSKTEPALKIVSVYPIATGTHTTAVNIRIVFNRKIGSNGTDTNLDLTGILFNGNQLYNGTNTSVVMSPAGETVYGGTQYNVSIKGIHNSELPTTITFPKGWALNAQGTLTEKQEFICTESNNYGSYSNLPKFVELPMQTVNYKVGDSVISTVNDTTITLADPATIDGYNSEKTFIGWTDGEKLYKAGTVIRNLTEETTFTAVEIGSFAQEAPELRTVGTAGVRFVTTFDSEDYALYEGKFFNGFGTIIARSADLTANNEKLTDVLTSDTTSVIVKIDSTVQGAKDGLTYVRGGIMNMYAHNFDKELVGAGYIAVEYATGVEYIVTAESKVVVKDVALNILSQIESGEASEEDFDMTLINAYAGINA